MATILSRAGIEDFYHCQKVLLALLCDKVKKYDLIVKIGGNDRKNIERETLGFKGQNSSN